MHKKENRRPDVIFKKFWRKNDRFASLFNTVAFGGRNMIRPEELMELDTDVSNEIRAGEYKETLTRMRDVVKKAAQGVEFVVMGIENQSRIHYAMPLRMMIYDSFGYLKEYQEVVQEHRKAGDKMTAEEFLSGMHREDRLHPIISIVIYYSEEPWDGPLSLKDMVTEMPEEIESSFADYKMNLLQAAKSEEYQFENEDVQIVFEAVRYFYQGEFEKIEKVFGDKEIEPDVGAMIGAITGNEQIVEEALRREGGSKMKMCTALVQLEEKCRKEGIEEGRKAGRKEMIVALLKAGTEMQILTEASGLSEEEIRKIQRETE